MLWRCGTNSSFADVLGRPVQWKVPTLRPPALKSRRSPSSRSSDISRHPLYARGSTVSFICLVSEYTSRAFGLA